MGGSDGRIEAFPLGAHDTSDRLLIPEKLYGREREIDDACSRPSTASWPAARRSWCWSPAIPASASPPSSTSCTRHWSRRAAFSQPANSTSTSATSLMPHWRRRSRAWSARSWARARRSSAVGATRCSEALGPNGQLIVDLIPELELIIGEAAAGSGASAAGRAEPLPAGVPALPRRVRAAGASARAVSRRFAMAGRGDARPLEHLITHPDVRHLLLVGAYRDNEVGPSHPLMRTLEAIRKAGAASAGDRAGASRTRRCRPTRRRCPALRAGACAAPGATGAREDRRQSVLRDPVSHGAGRRGAARIRPGRARLGTGISSASAPRATPTTSRILWSGS